MTDNKPVFEKRLGQVRLAIWENATDDPKKKWHNVSITRRYKQNDDWKETSTFNGLGDLALLGECVNLAKDWIALREQAA